MHKMTLFVVAIMLILSGCGRMKADVPNNADAKATQAIVQAWMASTETNDFQKLIPMYADDLVWMDYGDNYGPLNKGNYAYALQYESGPELMKVKFKTYLVTKDGRYAVIQSTFSTHSRSTNKWVSMPAFVILEFNNDGKITRESWYYNNSAMY